MIRRPPPLAWASLALLAAWACTRADLFGVRDEPSLGRTERRRTPGSDRQRPDVVGDLSVEEADPIGAGEAESAPEPEVEDGDGGPQGPVFGGGIPVVGDDLLATQDGEPSSEGFVRLMQHG